MTGRAVGEAMPPVRRGPPNEAGAGKERGFRFSNRAPRSTVGAPGPHQRIGFKGRSTSYEGTARASGIARANRTRGFRAGSAAVGPLQTMGVIMGLPNRFDPRRATIERNRFFATLDGIPTPAHADAVIEALRERTVESLRSVNRIMPRAVPTSYQEGDLAARAMRRMERANNFVKMPETVLDIGCGRGENLIAQEKIRPCRRIGLDISERLFAADCEFIKASVEAMPIERDSVDLVTSFNAFEHFDDPRAALSEILRVLKPGGVLYTEFGPPWNAAYGAHLKRRIALPFVQHLFPTEVVAEFLETPAPYAGKNGWSVRSFIDLFSEADCLAFGIRTQVDHLWLVNRLRPEFRRFEPIELVASTVIVALRKH